MGTERLRSIAWCHYAGFGLSCRSLWDQAHLPAGIGNFCLRFFSMRPGTLTWLVDRGPCPAGIWWWHRPAFGPGAVVPCISSEGAGDCAWVLRHRPSVRARSRSDFGWLARGYQSLACYLLHQYPDWHLGSDPGVTFPARLPGGAQAIV